MGLRLDDGSLSWPPAVVATANADAYANARHDAAADAADAAAAVASYLRWKLMRPPPVGVIDRIPGNFGYPHRLPRRLPHVAVAGAA